MSAQEQQNWYYASAKGEQQGPVLIGELSLLAAKGMVGPETLVWSEGYRDWIPANEISDLLTRARAAVHISPAHTTQASEPALDLKPRKALFVLPRFAMGLIVSGVVGGVITGLMTTIEKSPWPGLAVFAAGTALGAVAALVAYRKERYQVQDSRVICRRGGLLSDQTNELELRNITCVKVSLPWLRHKFFGVGNVFIETAGTSKPVVMRLIDEPEAIYAGMRERMKMNGYDLNQDQLLHEERPAIIGILGECFGLLGGAGFLLSGVIFAALSRPDDPATPESALVLLSASATVVIVAFVILRFLDYRHRIYRVYNGVVVYEEGFLTRENAFIPYENITDSNTRSSIFDRIFGLCDVQVSCQGSGAEIKFRRLKHGVALSAAIDRLVARGRAKEKPPTRSTLRDHPAPASRDLPRRSHPDAIPTGETMTGEYRMDAVRTLLPLMLLFPLLPIWIAAMLQGCIRLMSTRYSVRDGSLRHSYRFLTVHDREFAYDKITGVLIKQNLWDRMFGTMTLKFWSLGSGKALEFAHVSGRQLNLPALMRQAGIPAASGEPYEAQAAFTVPTWLRANLKHLPVPLLFCAVVVFAATQTDAILYGLLLLPVIAGSVSCLYSKVYHSRQRLRFHDHHIEAEQGVIARRRYFVRHSNVKRGMTTCYPGGGDGDLTIFVAAEEELLPGTQQKQNQRASLKQVSFTTGFLSAVRDKGLLLDDILCGRVEPAPDALAAEPLAVLLEARRSAGNSLMKLILLSIVLFPLIVLLPFTVPAMVIRVKRWRYHIEPARIVVSWGMLYRHETSILLDRVDSIQQSQGPLNKLFGNGNVSIMTAGSSKPDLSLPDSPEYLGMYEIIRERSQ